jgi:sugar-specific transcriptional regulator TrmB
MNYQQLQLLGLNSYEAKVLHTLMHKGALKVSQLSKESTVPNGQIYNTLDSLEEKGLINLIPDKVKIYVSKSILYIKELLKERKKELVSLDKELDELKEIENDRVGEEIQIARGKKGFHKLILEWEKMKLGSSPYVYEIKWNAEIQDKNILKIANNVQKKGKDKKVLYDINAPKENIKYWNKLTPNYNFIEADGIAMSICNHSCMISILDTNSTLLIKSKTFAKTMTQLFEGYWESKQ